MTQAKLKAGIVGGGAGAFIGAVHRIAAELDGQAEIVAGALSSDPQRAKVSAAEWGLARAYDTYADMADAEFARDDGIDFVIIAAPNHLHADIACTFLERDVPVICDKPLASTLADAQRIEACAQSSQRLFALTQTYTGYPMIRAAREFVVNGGLGELRTAHVEYQQDWLMTPLEQAGNKQAVWRTDPTKAGESCCVGDIGTHAFNLLEFVAAQRVEAVAAQLSTFVEGRSLDDDASMLLRLERNARGTLVCSQVACGEENNLRIRLYGSAAGLEWAQQEPNTLWIKQAGAPWARWRAGQDYIPGTSQGALRIPAGHPEGYLEAFANIYLDFMADVRRVQQGNEPMINYPSVDDGLRGLQFVAAALNSSNQGSVWVEM